jgi:hypothetical protein
MYIAYNDTKLSRVCGFSLPSLYSPHHFHILFSTRVAFAVAWSSFIFSGLRLFLLFFLTILLFETVNSRLLGTSLDPLAGLSLLTAELFQVVSRTIVANLPSSIQVLSGGVGDKP